MSISLPIFRNVLNLYLVRVRPLDLHCAADAVCVLHLHNTKTLSKRSNRFPIFLWAETYKLYKLQGGNGFQTFPPLAKAYIGR